MLMQCPARCAGWLPQRYIFVIMGGLAIFNAYAMRAAMSVAITEMAQAAAKDNATKVVEGSCVAAADDDTIGWLEKVGGGVSGNKDLSVLQFLYR